MEGEVDTMLIVALAASCGCLVVVQLVVGIVLTRRIVRTLTEINEKYEKLRELALENYVNVQRQENARLVADTRAATAKMNVIADALWDGLSSTVREVPHDPGT